MFGNALPVISQQIENMALAKLISLNSVDFDFNQCSFDESIMNAKDKNGGLSREGSGRVSIWKATGIPNSYTLEWHYSIGVNKNKLSKFYDYSKQQIVDAEDEETKEVVDSGVISNPYSIESYEYVGKAVWLGILDFYELSPISRIPTTKYKNLKSIKQEILSIIEEQRRNKANSNTIF